ncbi:hypothetical protein [uncultured Psychroserpens sp.]|uniref:hypothetical protein n=1 Tax=uncultured Psychroserpens sp. TaxID=255436 RepID=UPI00261560AB|nr:hypothetical protein [uncultured Psychroserpens sp.]
METKYFVFDSGYFEDINFFAWLIMTKILTLCILSIWYITCKYKWKFILLVPIIIEIYKLLVNFNFAKYGSEDSVYIQTFIGFIVYFFILLFFKKTFNFYANKNTSNVLINEEINKQLIKISKFDIKDYKEVKKKLVELQNDKHKLEKKQYLIQLIALRDQITF